MLGLVEWSTTFGISLVFILIAGALKTHFAYFEQYQNQDRSMKIERRIAYFHVANTS